MTTTGVLRLEYAHRRRAAVLLRATGFPDGFFGAGCLGLPA